MKNYKTMKEVDADSDAFLKDIKELAIYKYGFQAVTDFEFDTIITAKNGTITIPIIHISQNK